MFFWERGGSQNVLSLEPRHTTWVKEDFSFTNDKKLTNAVFYLHQVLSKEQYACWLQRHLEAEMAIQGREELLFESALRLETNLHLLGDSYCSFFARH